MESDTLQHQQSRIIFYENGVREIRRLTGEIDRTQSALTNMEVKLDELTCYETDLNKDKSILTREISLYKKQRSECEKGLSKTKSDKRAKQLTECITGENVEIESAETNLQMVNGNLETLTKEMQPLKEEASRLETELERLSALRNNLFDTLTGPSK